MKNYLKPTFEYIELQPEEKIAAVGSCVGTCTSRTPLEYWDSPGPS